MQPAEVARWFATDRFVCSGKTVWNKHDITLHGKQVGSLHAQVIDTIATVQIHHRAAKRACRRVGQQRNRLGDFHLPQGTIDLCMDSPVLKGSRHLGVDRWLGTGVHHKRDQRSSEQANPAAHGRRGI